jgi:two-component system OmpR family sensor kinase
MMRALRRFVGSTRGRLTLIQIAALSIAVTIAGAALYATLSVSQEGESDGVLALQARGIKAGLVETEGRLTFQGGEMPGETEGGVAVDAAVVGEKGVIVQTATHSLADSSLGDIAGQVRNTPGGELWIDVKDVNGVPRRVFAEMLPLNRDPMAVLVVSRSVRELQATLRLILVLLVVLSLVVVGLGGILAHWLAGRVLTPVRTIAGLARTLSERDLHRRVDTKVPDDELGELVATFNGMLARLEASFESLRRFTADASHELRAPLTLIRTELEVALTRARSPDDYIHTLQTLQAEVENLARTADQLLLLARADAGALTPARERIDVADFVHELAARWQATAAQRRVQLAVSAPDSGTVLADAGLTRRVLDNLLDNALRYAPALSEVTIRAQHSDGEWAFEVADQGPGVPPELRPTIFERFSRADSARSRRSRGAGLGLALGAAIAQAQGGTLELVPGTATGARFRLRLPEEAVERPR